MKHISKTKFFNYYLPFILNLVLIVAGALVYLTFHNPPEVQASWYSSANGTWLYRKQIIIDHTKVSNTNQTNFPVLINLTTDSDLSAHARSDGHDILFTDGTTTAKIPYERELYTSGTGNLVAWVKVATLSATTDTIIFMYYGNASDASDEQQASSVWDTNYKGVWHFPDGTTLGALDSTSGVNNGTITAATATTGQIDGAGSFNGTTANVAVANESNFDFERTNPFSVEFWVKPNSSAAIYIPIAKMAHSSPFTGWDVELNVKNGAYTAGYISLQIGNTFSTNWLEVYTTNITKLNDGSWHHYIFTYDGTSTPSGVKIYEDGSLLALSTAFNSLSASILNNIAVSIGSRNNQANWTPASLDETRISSNVRSADWIATEYNNQNSPSTFYTLGGQVARSSLPAALTGVNARGNVNVRGGHNTVSWYSTGGTWLYRKAITIDHTKVSTTGGDNGESNFPVLVSWASDSNLSAHARSDGHDILFTDASATAKIPYEREKFVSGTGELEAWVKIASLSATTNTIIYMYYGNASDASDEQQATSVWDTNYKAVYHLADNAANTTVTDSIGVVNGTSNANTSAMATSSIVDGGFNFNGSTDKVDLGTPANLNFGAPLTVEAWFNTTIQAQQRIVQRGDISTAPFVGYGLFLRDNTDANKAWFSIGATDGTINTLPSTSAYATGTWVHMAGTYDGTTMKLYLNGSQGATPLSVSKTVDTSTTDASIGWSSVYSNFFKGKIDEVRISNTNRSADWIATEYNNQNSPGTFMTVAQEITQPLGGVIFR